MVEAKSSGVDVAALMERVRTVAQRSTAPVRASGSAPARSGSAGFSDAHHAIEQVHAAADVGMEVPPMSRRGGLVRRAAVPAAKLVLRVAQLVTRDQRAFNHHVVAALRTLRHSTQSAIAALEQRLAMQVAALEQRLDRAAAASDLRGVDQKLHAHADSANARLLQLEQRLAELGERFGQARKENEELKLRLARSEARAQAAASAPAAPAAVVAQAQAAQEASYQAFEERYRGPREVIRGRVRHHLGTVRKARAGTPDRPVLDLGCGRGEWLEVLRAEGLTARGADLNGGFVAECRALGLQVEEADALSYLRALPEGSVGAVCGIHIAEHLGLGNLEQLVSEATRVLAPGGALLLETPNPKNLIVGASSFYLDPTHDRPLHPDFLAYLFERQGLTGVELDYLHPDPRWSKEAAAKGGWDQILNELLFGPCDYAAIGFRP